jgi:hypothetical protein
MGRRYYPRLRATNSLEGVRALTDTGSGKSDLLNAIFYGAGLRHTSTGPSPARLAIEAKGSTPRAAERGFFTGRATNRRGLAVVWPEKDLSMTRAAALKKIIRARAAKTGERYTTARRHVLSELHKQSAAPARAAKVPAPRTATSGASRGSVSDATALAKTGHDLAHWFAILDRFGAVDKGHTAAARHLNEAHRVPGWYAQGITVAYERARGLRALNQRGDGAYEVSVSKVVSGSAADVITVFTASSRRRWMKGVDSELRKALTAALDDPGSKGFVLRLDGQGRFRYKWDGTTVQFYLLPKKADKVSVVVTNTALRHAALVDERRTQWRTTLNALAARLAE